MPTEPRDPTLAEIASRAALVCDPEGVDEGVSDLLGRLEDRDEPITSIGDVEEVVGEARGAVDPQAELPSVSMAAAVVVYLAHRRTELDGEPQDILRLAARAEFDGTPPASVADWLAARGIEA